jgi:hypothetical protein
MKLTKFYTCSLSLCLCRRVWRRQRTVSGTVTDKTTGKPAAGDTVVLVEPMRA